MKKQKKDENTLDHLLENAKDKKNALKKIINELNKDKSNNSKNI